MVGIGGTTARRTLAVAPIHSEVNRLEHSSRGFPIHRPHSRRRLSTRRLGCWDSFGEIPRDRQSESKGFPLCGRLAARLAAFADLFARTPASLGSFRVAVTHHELRDHGGFIVGRSRGTRYYGG